MWPDVSQHINMIFPIICRSPVLHPSFERSIAINRRGQSPIRWDMGLGACGIDGVGTAKRSLIIIFIDFQTVACLYCFTACCLYPGRARPECFVHIKWFSFEWSLTLSGLSRRVGQRINSRRAVGERDQAIGICTDGKRISRFLRPKTRKHRRRN